MKSFTLKLENVRMEAFTPIHLPEYKKTGVETFLPLAIAAATSLIQTLYFIIVGATI